MPGAAPSTLIADIGGTNARFALTRPVDAAQPPMDGLRRYATADFASLKDALQDYLKSAPTPARAVLAVASAVAGDTIKITNNPWTFSISQLSRDLGMPVEVINDFTAMSSVLPALQAGDLHPIGAVATPAPGPSPLRSYAVVGPGTGLGVGGVVIRDGQATVIQSEGGHVGFAPGNDYELQILKALLPRFGRVSAERLICGPGLVNLYEGICAVEGLAADTLTPEQISAEAARDADGVCARTLWLFAELLGAFAGDMALAFGAWDGVFLAGGVAQKLLPWIEQGGFRQRFDDKGRHRDVLRRIPTQVITHEQAGLLGAAVHAVGCAATPAGPVASRR